MKIAFFFLAFLVSVTASAQIKKISFQASGLTCSMCSNSIYRALKTLDFVEKVDVDLKTYTYDLTFNDKGGIDFDKIKRKVEGAGFSIIQFIATVDFTDVPVTSGSPVVIASHKIVFMAPTGALQGLKAIRILDKGFVSAKEWKKNNLPPADQGIYHAAI